MSLPRSPKPQIASEAGTKPATIFGGGEQWSFLGGGRQLAKNYDIISAKLVFVRFWERGGAKQNLGSLGPPWLHACSEEYFVSIPHLLMFQSTFSSVLGYFVQPRHRAKLHCSADLLNGMNSLFVFVFITSELRLAGPAQTTLESRTPQSGRGGATKLKGPQVVMSELLFIIYRL